MPYNDWPEEKRSRFRAQEIDAYQTIGRFLVEFNHVVYAANQKIHWDMALSSRIEDNDIVSFFIDSLSDRKLIEALEVQFARFNKTDHPNRSIFKDLIKELFGLVEFRNRIVHRTWLVGWTFDEQEDWTKLTGIKGGKFHELSIDEIKEKIELCRILYRVFYTVWDLHGLDADPGILGRVWRRDPANGWIDLRTQAQTT